ncbi:hypothetical protein ACJRO7_018980 [Eucalyptus globulus]|uniref:Uncharacterized protein n=1 Tax=Eucalyptus globulus TaxID=34317 RepID=A0ABD3KZU5_EUCGL
MKQSVIKSTRSEDSKSSSKQPNCSGCVVAAKGKAICKQKAGDCHSKKLIIEKKKTAAIGDKLHTLRSLVPKDIQGPLYFSRSTVEKMVMTSIPGDAVDSIEDLQMEVRNLKEELGKSLARQRDNPRLFPVLTQRRTQR